MSGFASSYVHGSSSLVSGRALEQSPMSSASNSYPTRIFPRVGYAASKESPLIAMALTIVAARQSCLSLTDAGRLTLPLCMLHDFSAKNLYELLRILPKSGLADSGLHLASRHTDLRGYVARDQRINMLSLYRMQDKWLDLPAYSFQNCPFSQNLLEHPPTPHQPLSLRALTRPPSQLVPPCIELHATSHARTALESIKFSRAVSALLIDLACSDGNRKSAPLPMNSTASTTRAPQ